MCPVISLAPLVALMHAFKPSVPVCLLSCIVVFAPNYSPGYYFDFWIKDLLSIFFIVRFITSTDHDRSKTNTSDGFNRTANANGHSVSKSKDYSIVYTNGHIASGE